VSAVSRSRQEFRIQVAGVDLLLVLIAFDGSRELLVVQSRYQGNASPGEIGWIVPVPAVPKVGTMSPEAATAVFAKADHETRLELVCVSCWYFALLATLILRLLIALFGGSARWPRLVGTPAGNLVLLILAIPPVMILTIPVLALRTLVAGFKGPSTRWPRLVGTVGGNLRLLLYSFVVMIAFTAIPQFSDISDSPQVSVLSEEIVSGLNIKVIQARDSASLLEWLNEHNFRHDEEDSRVLGDYIRKGWVFVAAKAAPSASSGQVLGPEGMLVPLVLVFPTRQAVYPLALTATAGARTWIDLFVFAAQRVTTRPDERRIPLLYAATKAENLEWLAPYAEPKGLLDGVPLAEKFVTRFQARLSQLEMEKDLIFLPDGTKEYTTRWH